MKIAIDIDGTLNMAEAFSDEYFEKFRKIHKLSLPPPDTSMREWKQRYHLDSSLNQEFYNFFMKKLVSDCPLAPYSREIISKLHNLQIELYIVTSRDPKYPNPVYKGWELIRDTYMWIAKNHLKISQQNVIFGIKKKGLYCRENSFDFLIDDSEQHIEDCVDNNVPVIVMQHEYNKDVIKKYADNPIVYNSYGDWREVYRIVQSKYLSELRNQV